VLHQFQHRLKPTRSTVRCNSHLRDAHYRLTPSTSVVYWHNFGGTFCGIYVCLHLPHRRHWPHLLCKRSVREISAWPRWCSVKVCGEYLGRLGRPADCSLGAPSRVLQVIDDGERLSELCASLASRFTKYLMWKYVLWSECKWISGVLLGKPSSLRV